MEINETLKLMKEEMEIPLSMLSINFLNEIAYKGSYKGVRFMFKKETVENEPAPILKLYVWKDKFNFENTNKNEIKEFAYSYDEKGIEEGLTTVASHIGTF